MCVRCHCRSGSGRLSEAVRLLRAHEEVEPMPVSIVRMRISRMHARAQLNELVKDKPLPFVFTHTENDNA